MADLQRYGGGAFGLGGTLAARQYLDEPSGNRFTQPSVLFGLGTGALAAGLYLADIQTPVVRDEFWASHAITALPTGGFYAAFPKQQGESTVEQVRRKLLDGSMDGGSGTASGQRARVERQSGGSVTGMSRAR